MARIRAKIASDFLEVQEQLPDILKLYGLSATFVAKQADIPQSSFHRKMTEQKFTAREMIRICDVINR